MTGDRGSAEQGPRDTRQHQQLRGVGLVFTGVVSVQFGAALAATLFPLIGSSATVGLRLSVAAAVLVAIGGLRVRGRPRSHLLLAAALGLSMALMILSLYEAIDRMPLGAVITVEFLGPLAVAVALSRRPRDLVIAAVAGVGVVILAGGLDGAQLVGVVFALGAAAGWAAYITFNSLLARAGVEGALPLAAVVAAVVVAPWSLPQAGPQLLTLHVLLLGVAVAVLSSVVPHSADMRALRVVPPRLFGVMMSVHPAVAALAGFVVLGQRLAANQVVGMVLVVTASALAALIAAGPGRARAELAADGMNA
jgi:inner membrane transporter RhtA